MIKIHLKRIIAIVILSAMLISFFVACGRQAASGSPSQSEQEVNLYMNFREIPDVTEEEIDAIERIKEEHRYFHYGMPHSTEAFVDDTGRVNGYSAFFSQWLSQLFGIPFQPEIMEWEQLLDGLEGGSIDFSGALNATESRQNDFFMTDPIVERVMFRYRLRDSRALSEIQKDRILNYGFLNGSMIYEAVSAVITEEYNPVFANTYEEIHQMMQAGEVDVFFETDTAAAAFDPFGDVVGENLIPPVFVSVSFSTGNPELEPMISVVQKALDHGALSFLTQLYKEGYRNYQQYKMSMQFTEEEQEYLSHRNVVKMSAEYDNYPASFYNAHEGEWQGIVFDVIAEIEDLTGLAFDVVNEIDADWPTVLGMLDRGEVSIISELVRTPDREGHYLWPENAFFINNPAFISRSDFPNISINEILNLKVGVTTGTVYDELFHRFFPDHGNNASYDSIDLTIDALERGEVDLVLLSYSSLLFITNYKELPGYKANLVFDYPFYSLFGFNKEEVILTSIVDKVLSVIDTDEISSRWKSRTFDYRARVAEAQVPWIIGIGIVLLGGVVIILLYLKNRQAGRRLEVQVEERTMELNNALVELEASGKAKSIFLANMSHEMRTPLNAIIGMTTLGEAATELSRKDYCLTRIKDSSTHLLGMINDILDMSKIEADKMELSDTNFDFRKMVKRVSSIISYEVERKYLHFSVEVDERIPLILVADEQRLAQVLTNLFGNSVKFTPEGGSISLVARLVEIDGEKCTIEMKVRDTGIGMSKEQMEDIFESFRQAGNDTSRKFGGTGLGLSISKSIVEMMDGRVWVESELGKGSTFGFTVRAGIGEEKSSAAGEETELISQFPGKHILLAEDVEINREIVLALMEPTLVEIDCAEDGRQAVDMFVETPKKYDLIFMDIQMPEMDGYEATEKIRISGLPRAKEIPIIAMSANMFKEDVDRCYQVGMNGHIGKPLDFEKVMETLRRYFS